MLEYISLINNNKYTLFTNTMVQKTIIQLLTYTGFNTQNMK